MSEGYENLRYRSETNKWSAGQRIDSYRLVRALGTGTFGTVYLAHHLPTGTQVAMKLFSVGTQLALRQAFLNEARMLRFRHPHVMQYLDFGVEGETAFIVMEYAPRGALAYYHPPGTRVPLALVLLYVRQVAAALQYLHEQAILHCDIKPQNLLLNQRGEVLISDFGSARWMETEPETMSRPYLLATRYPLIGTAPYMAPEQILGRPQPASDQYALAVLVYEWLNGSLPFCGSRYEILKQHLLAPVPSLVARQKDLPPGIDVVLSRALAKNPSQRFSCILAFAMALDQVCEPLYTPYDSWQEDVRNDYYVSVADSDADHMGDTDGDSTIAQVPEADMQFSKKREIQSPDKQKRYFHQVASTYETQTTESMILCTEAVHVSGSLHRESARMRREYGSTDVALSTVSTSISASRSRSFTITIRVSFKKEQSVVIH